MLEKDEPWYWSRMRILDDRVRNRLAALSVRLSDADWLEGAFSAADLLMVMVMVLRRLLASNSPDGPKLLSEYPSLETYVARGEARPAYQRAFAAQRRTSRTSATDRERPGPAPG